MSINVYLFLKNVYLTYVMIFFIRPKFSNQNVVYESAKSPGQETVPLLDKIIVNAWKQNSIHTFLHIVGRSN